MYLLCRDPSVNLSRPLKRHRSSGHVGTIIGASATTRTAPSTMTLAPPPTAMAPPSGPVRTGEKTSAAQSKAPAADRAKLARFCMTAISWRPPSKAYLFRPGRQRRNAALRPEPERNADDRPMDPRIRESSSRLFSSRARAPIFGARRHHYRCVGNDPHSAIDDDAGPASHSHGTAERPCQDRRENQQITIPA